jgi:hypothetical protein
MKNIVKIIFGFSLLLLPLIIYSCSETNPIKSEGNEIQFSYSQSKCNSHLGKRSGNESNSANIDSSLSYTFNDTLKVDFGIWGNCCPDSQRFVTDYTIKSDTILITVKDIAKNGCYCDCNYTIHFELTGLTQEEYLFCMTYPGREPGWDSLKYREIIKKH